MSNKNILAALAVAGIALSGCAEKPLTYEANIKPLIEKKCVACHSEGGEGTAKTGLRLDSYDGLMKGTRFGPIVIPGSSVSSTLYLLVAGKADPSIRMPHGKEPMSQKEIDMIAKWIDQGAKK